MEEDDINTGKVFNPTYPEFQDSHKYIQQIESVGAHRYGIVKIVPPVQWKPKIKMKSGEEPISNPEDLIIIKPVRQEINGQGGMFTHRNSDECDEMTLAALKNKVVGELEPPPDGKSILEVEKLFWDNKTPVNKLPLYGPSQNGTLFDENENVWNINNLGSSLNILKEMKGIHKSYLYYGSKMTFFPVHTEDGNVYSANINHYGSPKVWYSVPPEDGERLEQLVAKFYPAAASKCPGFMRHKTFLVSPDMCKMFGIRCYRTVQYPGEIVVTFPFGYHWGFNMGYNIAEASNFATESYINFGKKASPCICGNPVPIHINVDCFVKLFQPDQYDAWRKDGKDSCELDFNWCPPAPKENFEGWREKVDKLLEEYSAKRPEKARIDLIEYLKLSNPVDPDAPPYCHPEVEFSTLDDRLYEVAAMIQADGNAIDTCKKKLFEEDETSCNRHSSQLHKKYGEMAPYCSMCHVVVHTKTLLDISDSPFQKNELTKVHQSRFHRSKVLIPECSFTMSKKDVSTKDVTESEDPRSEVQSVLLDCCKCELRVHAKCYGVDSGVITELENDGVEWTCDRCKSAISAKRCRRAVIKCCWLCGKGHGAMKIIPGTRSNKWVHLTCAMADPRIYFEDVPTRTISADMGGGKDWKCGYCKRKTAIRCGGCEDKAFHLTCAYINSLTIEEGHWPYSINVYCTNCIPPSKPQKSLLAIGEKVKVQKSEKNIVEAKVRSVRAVSTHTVDVLDETLDRNSDRETKITQEQFIGHDWSKIPGINSRVEVKLPKDDDRAALYKGFTVAWLYEVECKDKTVLTDYSREKIYAHGEKKYRKKAQKSKKDQEEIKVEAPSELTIEQLYCWCPTSFEEEVGWIEQLCTEPLDDYQEYTSAHVAGWLEGNTELNFEDNDMELTSNVESFMEEVVSRGGFKIPHVSTYQFVRAGVCYMQKANHIACCRTKLVCTLKMINNFYNFGNYSFKFYNLFSNVLLKGYYNLDKDMVQDQCTIKRARLSH